MDNVADTSRDAVFERLPVRVLLWPDAERVGRVTLGVADFDAVASMVGCTLAEADCESVSRSADSETDVEFDIDTSEDGVMRCSSFFAVPCESEVLRECRGDSDDVIECPEESDGDRVAVDDGDRERELLLLKEAVGALLRDCEIVGPLPVAEAVHDEE